MDNLQKLLNKEAAHSNEVRALRKQIREQRSDDAPACFGEDDCSTKILMICPWRFDCGSEN